jgi:hypothetical protein
VLDGKLPVAEFQQKWMCHIAMQGMMAELKAIREAIGLILSLTGE